MKNYYLLPLAALLAFSCNKKEEVKPVSPTKYTATKSYTATCTAGFEGSSVTKTATYESTVSQADADAKALSAATEEATKALACQNPLDKGVWGYYNLNGNANDSTGVLGNGVAVEVDFSSNTSATFNGTSSFIRIPGGTATVTTPDQLTFGLFVQPVSSSSNGNRVFQMVDEAGNSLELYLVNKKLSFTNWDQTAKADVLNITTPSELDYSTWSKIIAIVDFANNTASLYVNDQLVQTVTNATLKKLGSAKITLGKHQNNMANTFYLGSIDNFRIYNSVLDQALFPRFTR